jgi:hypothetical protein
MAVIVDLLKKGGCAWGKGARPAYLFLQGVADSRLQIALLTRISRPLLECSRPGMTSGPSSGSGQIPVASGF